LPGITGALGHTGLVHPQEEITLYITTGESPSLVNSKVQLCFPALIDILPKLCDVLLNFSGCTGDDCASAFMQINNDKADKILKYNILKLNFIMAVNFLQRYNNTY